MLYLIHILIICLYILFLMTGSFLNLVLKLAMRHNELENVNHGVLRDTLVEVSGNSLPLNRAPKVGQPIGLNMAI